MTIWGPFGKGVSGGANDEAPQEGRMSEIYELICPRCGFRTFSTAMYTTCVSCGTLFYASQSGPMKAPNWFRATNSGAAGDTR